MPYNYNVSKVLKKFRIIKKGSKYPALKCGVISNITLHNMKQGGSGEPPCSFML